MRNFRYNSNLIASDVENNLFPDEIESLSEDLLKIR